jgi:3-dehydroquinate synthase
MSAASNGTERITVRGEAPYDVAIGRDIIDELVRAELPEAATRVAIIHPPTLVQQAEDLRLRVTDSGRAVIIIEVPDGERAKTTAVADYCWSVLGEAGFTRLDTIIGFGGGATTDLAGFVAATWLRGVPLIQVPTTLLAMVDAAVGGKTGINTTAGKNLVGCFYPPKAVICDLLTLESMPIADYITGMAEVIKCGFISDPIILDLVEASPAQACDPTADVVPELVSRAVQVKADVVGDDLKESVGRASIGREVLNYGHTLGHAIERVENYSWRHGSAISVGMVFAAELSHRAGLLSFDVVARHRAVLSAIGLPIAYPAGRWPELVAGIKLDKKTRADLLRFVVLHDIAAPAILEGPDSAILVAAYEAISG